MGKEIPKIDSPNVNDKEEMKELIQVKFLQRERLDADGYTETYIKGTSTLSKKETFIITEVVDNTTAINNKATIIICFLSIFLLRSTFLYPQGLFC